MALATFSVVETLSNTSLSYRGLIAAASAFTIVVTVAVGVYAWHRDRSRFGWLLVGTGLLWGLVSLTASSHDTLHSVGRVSQWAAELALLYVILSYPSGVLRTRAERTVFFAGVALVLLLWLPTAFVVAHYDRPFPWESCAHGCPPNAFMLVNSQPGIIGNLVSPVRDALSAAVYAAAIGVLALRLSAVAPPLRQTLVPVLGAAILRLATAATFVWARDWTSGTTIDALAWIALLSIPLISVGFLIGLLGWRMVEARALERLTKRLSDGMDRAQLESAVSDALQDPTSETLFADPTKPGAWLGANGRPAPAPRASAEREVVTVPDQKPVVAIVTDAALHEPQPFVESVGACVFVALEQQRLNTALRGSLEEVSGSRARIAAAGYEERHRLEQDLHDSAQQQLVMLRVQLQLATNLVEQDPTRGLDRLREVGASVDDVLEEIRSVARGIYPPLLADAGIVEALRMATARASVPITVTAKGARRYSPAIESAVYFCCLEAIQNASKHTRGATVSIRLVDNGNGSLRFEVCDDGPGFSPSGNGDGAGLTNMRDRMAAVGGALDIETAPGTGTKIRGMVPAP
ncbi:MAG: sensor histidine kinase [Solirubrobacterales bacterium]